MFDTGAGHGPALLTDDCAMFRVANGEVTAEREESCTVFEMLLQGHLAAWRAGLAALGADWPGGLRCCCCCCCCPTVWLSWFCVHVELSEDKFYELGVRQDCRFARLYARA